MRACNRNIQKTLELTGKMIELANKGEAEREDNGCGILYGVLLDAAYKIQKLAAKEKKAHMRKGWWPDESEHD